MVAALGMMNLAKFELEIIAMTILTSSQPPRPLSTVFKMLTDSEAVLSTLQRAASRKKKEQKRNLMWSLGGHFLNKKEELMKLGRQNGIFVAVEYVWCPGHVVPLHNEADDAASKARLQKREVYITDGVQVQSAQMPIGNPFDKVKDLFLAAMEAREVAAAPQIAVSHQGPSTSSSTVVPASSSYISAKSNSPVLPGALPSASGPPGIAPISKLNVAGPVLNHPGVKKRGRNRKSRKETRDHKQMLVATAESLEKERQKIEQTRQTENQRQEASGIAYERYLEESVVFRSWDEDASEVCRSDTN
ncbi:hypothetical protein QBC43DRAFT_338121 [Cladorrhinum sp. PSN259]|nr:hypothetical protein QBC43DRAFT_338121 [Cladorrhinum sp. PSN259]